MSKIEQTCLLKPGQRGSVGVTLPALTCRQACDGRGVKRGAEWGDRAEGEEVAVGSQEVHLGQTN